MLRKLEIVRVERPKQGSNHYLFLWQPGFQRANVSRREHFQDRVQSADAIGKHRADSSARICSDSAKVLEELRVLQRGMAAPTTTAILDDAVRSIGMDNLLAAPRGMIRGPWEQLNDLTNGGPRPGELWLVGARTGIGKSTFCLQWAVEARAPGIACSLPA